MKSFFCRFVLLALLLCSRAVAWPAIADAQTKDGKELVTASLVTDVGAIQPGQRFRIGVLYQIEPGWHIYWKYPGDSGIPTKIDWKLPAGFKVGKLQWPLPIRDKEPGDLEVFGYESEVLLFADVEVPKDLAPRPIELRAKSDWLVCQSSCIPGSAELSAKLNVGSATGSPSAAIFGEYAKKVPKQLPSRYKVVFNRSGKNLQLTVEGAPLDLFPVPPETSLVGHASQTANKVTLHIDTEQQPINRLDGVLVIGTGSERQGFEITAAAASSQPESFPASAPFADLPGLLQALILAILGGLILNVMPCVLPVISLKIFGFVREAGERPEKIFQLSLLFSAGILSCFALLALGVIYLEKAGAEVGWGFQFQDYRFLLLLSCLLFAFALNLFGVYEFAVSARATGGLARLAKGRVTAGRSFRGSFSAVLATPCSAPFLGTASAFALAQPAWITFLMFLFIGLGMAFPFSFSPRIQDGFGICVSPGTGWFG